mmetsp:Transcript_20143/g.42340  ORF Transcript_20143/g.42340 Transcript_20143/m.42340 type:complete len:108 (-) Transcript_20143:209-532(-)
MKHNTTKTILLLLLITMPCHNCHCAGGRYNHGCGYCAGGGSHGCGNDGGRSHRGHCHAGAGRGGHHCNCHRPIAEPDYLSDDEPSENETLKDLQKLVTSLAEKISKM